MAMTTIKKKTSHTTNQRHLWSFGTACRTQHSKSDIIQYQGTSRGKPTYFTGFFLSSKMSSTLSRPAREPACVNLLNKVLGVSESWVTPPNGHVHGENHDPPAAIEFKSTVPWPNFQANPHAFILRTSAVVLKSQKGRQGYTNKRKSWLTRCQTCVSSVRPDGNWDSQLKLKENSKSCWCIPCQPETWQPGLLSCLGAKLKQNLSVKIYTPSRMWYFYRLHYIYQLQTITFYPITPACKIYKHLWRTHPHPGSLP